MKTVRLPEEVVAEIETWPGDNFTEKLVMLVRCVAIERDRLTEELQQLRDRKQTLITDVADLERSADKLRAINRSFSEIYTLMLRANEQCKSYAGCISRVTRD